MERMKALATVLVVSLAIAIGLSTEVYGQANASIRSAEAKQAAEGKKYDYKGISVGITLDAVRSKLGGPKEKSDEMDQYIFSANETAQVYYNEAKQVRAIMITYSGDLKDAPTAKDVFGEDVAPKADGGVFKMERYPKEGFWISYNRIAGADGIVTIAVQKM
jgi:hypothetical protein